MTKKAEEVALFKRILVPLDGSDLAEQVIGHLEPILQLESPELHLLRAVLPLRRSGRGRQREEASEYLTRLAETVATGHGSVQTHVEEGDPAAAILEFVTKNAPSLVAMSTHGASGVSRWIHGSVAERVLRHCPRPILMTNPQAAQAGGSGGFRKILVPLDGSDPAEQIVRLVEQFARLYQAEVHLLCVEEPEVRVMPTAAPPVMREGPQAEEVLEPHAERLRTAGIDVRTIAATGQPAEWILKTAEEGAVDLLAMSTHGRSGPSRWLFGSVAEKVLRNSPCPLLLRRITKRG